MRLMSPIIKSTVQRKLEADLLRLKRLLEKES
jgi:hypothetical protein